MRFDWPAQNHHRWRRGQAGELLLGPIRRTLCERVRVMPVEQVEVVPSQLGDNAGVIGVACWAARMSDQL